MSQITPSDDRGAMHRRTFCAGTLAALAGLAAVSCGGGGGAASAPPPPPPAAGDLVTTDTRSALLASPAGTTRDYRNLGNFLLIRDSGGIYAMTAVCTHQGCTVGLPSGGQIACPCHGSLFDLGGGNLLGPAVSPLVHLQVTEPTPGGFLVVNNQKSVDAAVRLA